MFENLLKHIKSRRQWNRTKRFMADRARSRCLVGLLYINGSLRRCA